MSELPDITAPPVTLDQAMDMVGAWPEEFGFQLHQIARTLYMEVLWLRDEVTRLETVAYEDGVLREERDQLLAERDALAVDKMVVSDDGSGIPAQDHLISERNGLGDRCQELEAEVGRLQGLLEAMARGGREVVAERNGMGDQVSKVKGLEDEVGRLQRLLEAMARAGREERLELDTLKAKLRGMQQTFDMRWDADQRAIKRWEEAHPGSDRLWPDHADMVVWLLECLDTAYTMMSRYGSASADPDKE